MITFLICVVLLIVGYMTYGKFVDKVFAPDDRPTPAIALEDGVDYVPMDNKKIFLIQLLNIAGLGPITGALQGALWGPVVYFWIVLGTILAGGVHDYMTGMLSMRNSGGSISEIVGRYLGTGMKQVMRVFSTFLLLMVGTVFAVGPSSLLAMLTPSTLNKNFWLIVILLYYFLATLLPIDKLIGKVYPFFGVCLIIMAVGVGAGLIIKGYPLPEVWSNMNNQHPSGTPIWPFMFITVACGAISGFHATQSPLMARCLKSERTGRQTFYGAMVAEGIIAMVWASAGVCFYETTGGLAAVLTDPNIGPNGAVYQICMTILGPVGGGVNELLLDGDHHLFFHLTAQVLSDNSGSVEVDELAKGGHDAVFHQGLDYLRAGLFHPAGQLLYGNLVGDFYGQGRFLGDFKLETAHFFGLLLPPLVGEGHLAPFFAARVAELLLALLAVPTAAAVAAVRHFLEFFVVFVQVYVGGLAGVHHLCFGHPGGGRLTLLLLLRLLLLRLGGSLLLPGLGGLLCRRVGLCLFRALVGGGLRLLWTALVRGWGGFLRRSRVGVDGLDAAHLIILREVLKEHSQLLVL